MQFVQRKRKQRCNIRICNVVSDRERRKNWTVFESSLDCILKQICITLAHGVSIITFYCGKAIKGQEFMFLTSYLTHMNIKERTVKTTHFWKSVKRDTKPITGINFLRIARGHFL